MKNISELRKEINKIDKDIIALIAKRYRVVKKIGEQKKKNNLNIEDRGREKWLHDYYESLSIRFKLDPKIVQKIFAIIIKQAKKNQK
jgi:chorismate mutase